MSVGPLGLDSLATDEVLQLYWQFKSPSYYIECRETRAEGYPPVSSLSPSPPTPTHTLA